MMISHITKLMRFRPPRTFRTDVVYIHGPPGTGKTTTIIRVLKAICTTYPEIDYYCKLGGLDRWFDGYDNQQIVYIDVPIAADTSKNPEAIQRLKNIMSKGDVLVEIKGGSMVFDSSLIIISSNIPPKDLAASCGIDNQQAIYRRLTDTCGTHFIESRSTCLKKLTEFLIKIIARNLEFIHNIHIDVNKVIHNIPNLKIPKYNDIQLHECNTSKYFH